MAYSVFRARVVETQRISPNFQRVRLAGLDQMGPAGPIRDLRIKLIFPAGAGLPPLEGLGDDEWFATWRGLDPATRGHMRTYSIRAAYPSRGEIDIDFVLHTAPGATGPASTWAATARPGDEILVCGPTADDASGTGIEFRPGPARRVHLFGDETALPAIARIIADWPTAPLGLTGTVHVEVPVRQDQQILALPNGVSARFYARGNRPHGGALLEAAANLLGTEVPEYEEATGDTTWETPVFSATGEEITQPSPGAGRTKPAQVGPADETQAYFWIAGEASLVTTMRRMLVKQVGIPRAQVSFMGYWRRGHTVG